MKHLTIFILILLSAFSIYRSYLTYNNNQDYLTQRFGNNKTIKLETIAQIKSEVGSSNGQVNFLVKDINNNFHNMDYKVTAPEHELKFGNCLKLSGNLARPENTNKTPEINLMTFPYREYLAKDNVYLLYKVNKLESANSCQKLSTLDQVKLIFLIWKQKITNIFLQKYEQPYAGFVAGVLIAGKGLMSTQTLEIFKRVSLSHVIVLSGSNVSMVVLFIKFLFDFIFNIFKLKENRLTEFFKKILMIIFITSFVLLTGGGPPIYRAFISTFCGLVIFKKNTSQLFALTVVVLLMTISNPFQSLYDPSFHLTCCATYGLIMFSKYFDKRIIFSWLGSMPDFLREILSVTVATQVFVFPYIIFMSSSFSSVFLFSNMIVLPLIPFIMLLGFLSLFPYVSDFMILINNIILHLVFFLVKFLSEVPYGYLIFNKNVSIWILVLYGGFVFWLMKKVRDSGE
jgi:competence protein ComEC